MIITITEFKSNIDMYLKLASTEDIIITKYGKAIARLTEPKLDKMAILNSLVGIAKGDEEITLDELRDLRLARQWDKF